MRAGLTGLRTAVVATVGVVVLGVTAVLAAHQPAPPTRTTRTLVAPGNAAPTIVTAAGADRLPWWSVIVAVGLLVLVGVLLWSVLRDSLVLGARRDVEVDPSLREDELGRRSAELAAVADLALVDAEDDLTAGADAREVVVACWVRIETAAGAVGLGRRPAETATDVARRWLANSPDRHAVDELAALYHLARYSTHPMTEAHRARARTALRGALGVAA